jgi:hypothetical protein
MFKVAVRFSHAVALFWRVEKPMPISTAAGRGDKKADVTEYLAVFCHVGLLYNQPPALPGCPLSSHPTT